MKKVLLIALALSMVLGVAALAGCSKPASEQPADLGSESQILIVATDAPYPPMEMVEPDGSFTGFDIDLFTAAAKTQGIELEFRVSGFDSLIAAMGSGGGDFDAAISSITITEERSKNMLFSDPYFAANQSLAVPSDSSVTRTSELKAGDKVAVQTGTTGEIWAKEHLAPKGIEVKGYALIPDCFGAMLAKDADAVIADFQVAADYAKDPVRKAEVVEQIDTGEQYGIAFPTKNEEVRDKINQGLKEIKEDGTYVELFVKYFGVEPAVIP